ncbi:2-oxo acid dehydrogenase subunit E2 [Erysipelothrix piscisicarius]|uniref:2-oxo acid dehydrogenase subunit E2 n=1 Tax=Erysipelothrix piscisicarius TaxID=2485784 RepID=UPI002F95A7D5
MRKYPILNSSVDDSTQEIVYKNFINIGFAADTPHGLYVPNIKNADSKGIFTVAKEISTLAAAANDNTLAGADMRDGSITISNIGSARGLWFTPIINYPEVAILGVGRIDKKPVVLADGTIGVGNMLALSLSFDHRIIDGALAQNAMNELKRLLNNPELLLMES